MGGIRLTEYLWSIYGLSEGRTVCLQPVRRPYGTFTARWKAVQLILRSVSRTYGRLGALFRRQARGHLRRDFLCIFLRVLRFY